MNKIKEGRKYFHLTKDYSKYISFEWSLRPLDILNFNFTSDGGERRYTFSFWFIWVFYISINYFNKYPKEWNQYTNNKQGGYLDTATRIFGVKQHYSWISFYLWHSGDTLWNQKKDKQYGYFSLDLKDIFIGDHAYKSSNTLHIADYREFEEGLRKIECERFTQTKTYKRFYMKPFQKKTYHFFIESDIEMPNQKIPDDWFDGVNDDDVHKENEHTFRRNDYKMINDNDDSSIYIDKYVKKINDSRDKFYQKWVPFAYRKRYIRLKKLENILKDE